MKRGSISKNFCTMNSESNHHNGGDSGISNQPPRSAIGDVRLQPAEQAVLEKCEQTIAMGVGTFVLVGSALAQIKDQKLYRQKYHTFADYCRDRWGFGKSHAHRLIDAAEVVKKLCPIGDTASALQNEAQARALIKVPEQKRAQVLSLAKQRAGSSSITAKLIESCGIEVLGQNQTRKSTRSPAVNRGVFLKWVGYLREVLAKEGTERVLCVLTEAEQRQMPVLPRNRKEVK